jgi:putative ABC transport system substrate-binding protein
MNRSRRHLLLYALATPLLARAQGMKTWRVAFLYYGSGQSASDTGRLQAFVRAMRDLGYAEGKNLRLEAHYADGDVSRARALAREIVASKPDVIVSTGGPPTRALQQATKTIPIVITVSFDAVREGFAASFARPGGNITGLTGVITEMLPKHLELLSACVPGMRTVGVLLKSDNPVHRDNVGPLLEAADAAGVRVHQVGARTLREIEDGVASAARAGVQGLIILPETFFIQQMKQIAESATRSRLPSIYYSPEYPAAGGLMSYGPSITDHFSRAAIYVDKILRGAKPADLAIERSTRLYLVINRGIATQLGISVPQQLLMRADEVI